jgi:hypothetical protein
MTPIRLECVKPRDWKRALALIGKRKDPKLTQYQKKLRSWEKAAFLFPALLPQLKPKTSCFDKAEALLLAYYGAQFIAPDMELVPV